MQYVELNTIKLFILHSFTATDLRVFSYLKKFSLPFLLDISQVFPIVPTFIVPCDKLQMSKFTPKIRCHGLTRQKERKKRSDSVLCQKTLHPQKNKKNPT